MSGRLVLVRQGEILSEDGFWEVRHAGEHIAEDGLVPDVLFTSADDQAVASSRLLLAPSGRAAGISIVSDAVFDGLDPDRETLFDLQRRLETTWLDDIRPLLEGGAHVLMHAPDETVRMLLTHAAGLNLDEVARIDVPRGHSITRDNLPFLLGGGKIV